MPELPAVPGCLEMLHRWSVGSDNSAQTKTHWKYLGPQPSGGTLTFVAEAVRAAGAEWLHPLLSNANSNNEIVITDLASKEGTRVEVAGFGAGGRPGTPAPANCAALCNFDVARRYRGGKPRNYFPFGCQSDIQGETAWTPAFLSLGTEKINAWIQAVARITHEGFSFGSLIALGYYEGGHWEINPVTGLPRFYPKLRVPPRETQIVAAAFNTTIGSMRRRLRPG